MEMSSSMNMASATATSVSMPMSTGMSDMSSMGGCKISMTWNWYTIGACFISKQWRITSSGMFAGSCIGVIFLVISLEFLRRTQREYDALLQRRDRARRAASLVHVVDHSALVASDSGSDQNDIKSAAVVSTAQSAGQRVASLRITKLALLRRQAIRAVLHTLQFAVAYFVMLLAMYYNGYIIICILIGAFIGSFVFSWDQLLAEEKSRNEAADVTGCCG